MIVSGIVRHPGGDTAGRADASTPCTGDSAREYLLFMAAGSSAPFKFAIAALGKRGMKADGKDGSLSVGVHQHLQPVSA
jgi:hypothetical protein